MPFARVRVSNNTITPIVCFVLCTKCIYNCMKINVYQLYIVYLLCMLLLPLYFIFQVCARAELCQHICVDTTSQATCASVTSAAAAEAATFTVVDVILCVCVCMGDGRDEE